LIATTGPLRSLHWMLMIPDPPRPWRRSPRARCLDISVGFRRREVFTHVAISTSL